MRGPKPKPITQRLWEKIIPIPECGCWFWMGSLDTRGYGSLPVNRRTERAHRASWEVYRGPIPKGMFVLHSCDIRFCVNPDHLFLGTNADNIRDMWRKGRRTAGYKHRKRKSQEAA